MYDPMGYAGYGLLGASVLVSGYAALQGSLGMPHWQSVLAGLALGGAAVAEAVSIDRAPNAGLASAIFRSQSGLTVLAAVALLHGELDVVALLAVIITLTGVYLASTGRQTSDKRAAEQHRQVMEKSSMEGVDPSKGWVRYAFIAAGLMTVKDLLTVLSVRAGTRAEASVAVELIMATIVALSYKRIKTGTWELVPVRKTHPAPWWVLPAGGVIMGVWPLLLVTAMKVAPNSGYPKALSLSGIAISALASSYIYNEPLTDRAWGGIALIILGSAGLMFRNR